MKKLLLLTIALVAFGATTALAASPGINLSWANCSTLATAANKNQDCSGANGTAGFQGTFRSAIGINDFAGTSSVVDIGFGGPVPDFWKTGTGECNANALLAINPSVAAPCVTPNIFDATASGGGFAIDHPSPNRIRLRIDWATGAAVPPVVAAGSLYPAFKIQLDLDQGVNQACAGCDQPACLVVNSIEIFGFVTGEDYVINTQDSRQYVTYQGGAIGGNGCPAETPSQNRTWGSVKALYR